MRGSLGVIVAFALFSGLAAAQFFLPQTSFSVGASPWLVAACDLNKDGRSDIVSANFEDNSISVLLNTNQGGSATFAAQLKLGPANGPYGIACGDFNNDGWLDIMWNNDGTQAAFDRTASVMLSRGVTNGVLSFAPTPLIFTIGFNPSLIALCDLNRDGLLDAVHTNTNDNTISIMFNTLNNATGALSFNIVTTSSMGSVPYAVACSDLHGDGHADIVLTNAASSTVAVLENSIPQGQFVASFVSKTYNVGNGPNGVALGDFNKDGYLDIVVSNLRTDGSGVTVSVLINQPTGAGVSVFASPVQYRVGSQPGEVAVADFDGNGRPDIVVTSYANAQAVFLMNNGAGTVLGFSPAQAYTVGRLPSGVAVGEFNGGGLPDVVTSSVGSASVSVLLNTPIPQSTVRPGTAAPVGSTSVNFTTASIVIGVILGIIGLIVVTIGVLLVVQSVRARRAGNAVAGTAAPMETIPASTAPAAQPAPNAPRQDDVENGNHDFN